MYRLRRRSSSDCGLLTAPRAKYAHSAAGSSRKRYPGSKVVTIFKEIHGVIRPRRKPATPAGAVARHLVEGDAHLVGAPSGGNSPWCRVRIASRTRTWIS